MILIYVSLGVLLILWIQLYRTVLKLFKYQSFKSNVVLRVALEKDMKELADFEKAELGVEPETYADTFKNSHWKRDRIIEKISKAIDEEIDNEPIPNWPELINAINAEKFFQMEMSEPFQRAFGRPSEIIQRHKERNKEYIK